MLAIISSFINNALALGFFYCYVFSLFGEGITKAETKASRKIKQ